MHTMPEAGPPEFIAKLPPPQRPEAAAKFHGSFAQHLERKSQDAVLVGSGMSEEYKQQSRRQKEVADAQKRGGPTERSSWSMQQALKHQDETAIGVKDPYKILDKSLTNWVEYTNGIGPTTRLY